LQWDYPGLGITTHPGSGILISDVVSLLNSG
jgi:hypothetical protein